MATTLYMTALEARSGKSAIALGLMRLIASRVRKVAFFRPIISSADPTVHDHDINLIRTYFQLDTPYEDCFACSLEEARSLINEGATDTLMAKILRHYKTLEAAYDFILCEGTDFLGKDPTFEFDLNTDIAASLGCPVLFVSNGAGRDMDEIQSTILSGFETIRSKGTQAFGAMVNMATFSPEETAFFVEKMTKSLTASHLYDPLPLVAVLPGEASLGKPSIQDVARHLKARIVYAPETKDILVDDYLVAAMQVDHFLAYLREGNLIITPGDRADIVLGSISARLSSACPNPAGILLTGGIELAQTVRTLIDGWPSMPLPIMAVDDHTYKTMQTLTALHGRIEPDDTRKIHNALGHFERHVDTQALLERLIHRTSSRMTPLMFEFKIMEQAHKQKMRIVLPEGEEERILHATEILLQRDAAEIILLGDEKKIRQNITTLGLYLDNVTIIDPVTSPDLERFTQTYYTLRKHKGISLEDAHDKMMDSAYFGTMMVHLGLADGLVSGAVHTTAHTIRPALEFVKTRPGFSIVSSVFFMCLKDRVLAFGDCAVNPDPTPEQLADIAINSAETAKIFGLEPRVAMLSYSTGTSGTGADVDKVAQATQLAKERAPNLLIEGPLQYDAAIDPEVARTKAPNSSVAGRATVFIFPDLNTGNNTYKAVQRAAEAIAIGPILQGLNKPVNDLSRGCTVPDIVNTVAITAVQAQAQAPTQAQAQTQALLP